MKRIAFLIFTLAHFTAFSSAQTQVSNFIPGVTQQGVNYFLPQTALRITVVAEKTVITPGELNKYAFRFLRMQDVPSEASTTWKIKEITIEPYGVPDSKKAYSILVKNKTVAPLVSLTRSGILLAINTEEAETSLQTPPQSVPAPPILNPKQFLSQEILSAGSSAKMAELCAQEIYDIRDSRNALVRGEADNTPKDGMQLKLMLDQLETQTQAIEQLFSGTTQVSTEVFTFDYLPSKETDKEVLFRFSQFTGAVANDDLSGSPIYISVKNTGNLSPRQEQPENNTKKKFSFLPFLKNKVENGIRYNMPAQEKITIFDVNRKYLETTCNMGQFGYTEILSDALFNKKSTIKVHFHQDNGGVKKLEQ